jgi:polyhydroxyalkanoate synthesis regulator phasin
MFKVGGKATMEPEKSFWEANGDLWGEVTESYADAMFKALEKSLALSTSVQEQIDRAVVEAVRTHLTITLSAIKALEQEVQRLEKQVDKLLQENE